MGVHRYGRFDFDGSSLDEHAEEHQGNDELVDLAAMQTLLHAGTVYGADPKRFQANSFLPPSTGFDLEVRECQGIGENHGEADGHTN